MNGSGLLAHYLVFLFHSLTGQRQGLSIILMDTVQKLILAHLKANGQIFLVTLQIFSYVKEIQQFHPFSTLNSNLLDN